MPALSDTLWLEMFYCPVYLLYLLSHRSLLLLLVCSNVNDFNFFYWILMYIFCVDRDE